jgi:hypothetical protein
MSTHELEKTDLAGFLGDYFSNPEHSEQQVAERFKVSLETVRRWRNGEFWEDAYLMQVIIRLLRA